MDHVVAIPYSLASSPEDFIARWNSDPDLARLAVATPAAPRREEYAGELIDAFLVVLGSLSSGVAGNALYDYLRSFVSDDRPETVTYRHIKLPDGTEVTELITSND
jgi:hypothetical protein